MIENGQKPSLLISSQLPEFIRDDESYEKFVAFVNAYYEWMEQNGKVLDRTKNLLNYADIDKTSDEFLDYFYNDFLSYFPSDIIADKQKVVKIAKQLYQAKGTPDSFRFLFRLLYNTDVDFFYTKDAVFKASVGKWYVAKSLKLATADTNFLNVANYRLLGETTKSIAVIDDAITAENKIEIFISDIQRLFQSGEFVRVVDSNNQDVLFNGQALRAKIVGQISSIKVNPANRGLLYRPGDPVVITGGLNSVNGLGATAIISETTSGSIQRIKVENQGYGYRADPNTIINITDGGGALAIVGGLNPSANSTANVTFIPTDIISLKRFSQIGAADYKFSNIAISNANTTLANAFTFTGFSTFPLSAVLVKFSGGGITTIPKVEAISQYQTEIPEYSSKLKSLGILAPIQINNGGQGYQVNDTITFSTVGSGKGAYANVSQVDANGKILSVNYVYGTKKLTYPLGGLGFRPSGVPTVTVNSSNTLASNASLYVPGILGDGATFTPTVDRVGSITTITMLETGEDYISAPTISLKVQDVVVSNVFVSTLPKKGDVVYQGQDVANSSYRAIVDSTTILVLNGDPKESLYTMRVFDYTSKPNTTLPLKIESKDIIFNINTSYPSFNTATRFDSTGVITYGDGKAKGSAAFLNGLVISQGQYLDTAGQPSSFDVLQSTKYNNYTYQITLEKEIAKYRDTLLNLVHPTGMQVIGRYAMKSNSQLDFTNTNFLNTGYSLGYYTGDGASYVTMSSTWNNASNNIVTFNSLVGANLSTFLFSNSTLVMTLSNGFKISSEVINVYSNGANTVTLKDNVWLTYANVAYVHANSGSNVINISSLTGSYNIVNGGAYSNTSYPLKDIVFAGDKVLVANNTEKTVQSVDYVQGTVTLTTNLSNNANSLMSVQRTVSTTDVMIYNSVGLRYYAEILTQSGYNITTQDDKLILIG
jgi:hypothetical protein